MGNTTSNDPGMFQKIFNELYSHEAPPQQIDYTARNEEDIRNSIASWLQPGYDQAITERKVQTRQNNANLDADAIARGMGASTYVTDVKNRSQNDEASDIASLRADYGSTLAKNVYDGVNGEKAHVLEVNEFNTQQRQQAYDRVYQAALTLYQQYLGNPKAMTSFFPAQS